MAAPPTNRAAAPAAPFFAAQVEAAKEVMQITRVPYAAENVGGVKDFADPSCSSELMGLHLGAQIDNRRHRPVLDALR